MKIRCISFSPTDRILFNTEVSELLHTLLNFKSLHRSGQRKLTLSIVMLHSSSTQIWTYLKFERMAAANVTPCEISWNGSGTAASWTLCSVPWNKCHNSLKRKKKRQKGTTEPCLRGVFLVFSLKLLLRFSPLGGKAALFLAAAAWGGEGSWASDSRSLQFETHRYSHSTNSHPQNVPFIPSPHTTDSGMLPHRLAFQLKEQVRQSCCPLVVRSEGALWAV